jgi:hypothetical protein
MEEDAHPHFKMKALPPSLSADLFWFLRGADEGAQLPGQHLPCDCRDGVSFRFQLMLECVHRCDIARLGKLERPFERGDVLIHDAHANSKQSKNADTAMNSVWMWLPGS